MKVKFLMYSTVSRSREVGKEKLLRWAQALRKWDRIKDCISAFKAE